MLFSEAHIVSDALLVLDAEKIWAVKNQGIVSKPYKYDDLIGYKVVLDGNEFQSSNAGKVALGAFFLGAAGALMGAAGARHKIEYVNNLRLQISVRDVENPMLQIVFISDSILKSSDIYQKKVQECEAIVSMLDYIKGSKQELQNQPNAVIEDRTGEKARAIYAFSVADEISKFHQLALDGIITEEEFQQQKQKLLSLDY